jgi:hypothetical protein
MLQSEPGNFLFVRPEDVIAFHQEIIPPAGIFHTRIFARDREDEVCRVSPGGDLCAMMERGLKPHLAASRIYV